MASNPKLHERRTNSIEVPELSIIIPTFKEVDNITILLERLFASLENSTISKEVLIIDDNSQDGTRESVQNFSSKRKNDTVRFIERTNEKGLSSAVLKGFDLARGNYLICMDADLQHPPESVIHLLSSLQEPSTEFVIGTRYKSNKLIANENWPLHRRVISQGAKLLTRPLTGLSDPMTGFFGVKKSVFGRGRDVINPIGFKIALEIFVKCDIQKYSEIFINFGSRHAGSSKLNTRIIVSLLFQAFELYWFKYPLAIITLILIAISTVLIGAFRLL